MTPQFVLDYISYLTKLIVQYPVEAYSRYGRTDTPPMRFVSRFNSSGGWEVLHEHALTGELLLIESVEPALATEPPLPPLEFDTTLPIVVPQYAPPDGYFILAVENKGLPPGYAANTIVNITANSDAVADGGSGFRVPFRGRYELPVRGRTYYGDEIMQLRYDYMGYGTIRTLVGDYEAIGPFTAINPNSGEFHRVVVNWGRVDAPIQELPPQVPPVVLPPAPPVVIPPRQIGIIGTQAQPIFYPSTTPQPPAPMPLDPPYYRLTAPLVDPNDTFRAISVNQMYSVSSTEPQLTVYDIGIAPNVPTKTYRIRNNTTNAVLKFTFTVPPFLKINAPAILNINPQEQVVISVTFNEADAREKSITKTYVFDDVLRWSVLPTNLSGPVYVARNLPPVNN